MTKKLKTFCYTIIILSLSSLANAQNCNCTLTEVENNTATPCSLILGTID